MDDVLTISVLIYIVILAVLIAIGVLLGKRRQVGNFSYPRNMTDAKNLFSSESMQLNSFAKAKATEPDFGPRYVVTEQPEKGYVILNGVKRKLRDCRNL